MKIFLIFMVFLLSIQIALAQNITWGNITIRIPNITVPRLPNVTITWNETERVDVLELLKSIKIPELIKERLKRLYEIVINAVAETIGKTLMDVARLLIKGNVTENETNITS